MLFEPQGSELEIVNFLKIKKYIFLIFIPLCPSSKITYENLAAKSASLWSIIPLYETIMTPLVDLDTDL